MHHLIRLGKILALWLGICCLFQAKGQGASKEVEVLDLWPHFPLPSEVIVQKTAKSLAEKIVQQTAAGLAAHYARSASSPEPYIWVKGGRGRDSELIFQLWKERTHISTRDFTGDVWQMVKELKERGVVKGYVLYRADRSESEPYGNIEPGDVSLNIATSVCGPLGAIAVEAEQEPLVQALGLPLLADCRGKNYAWVFETIGKQYNDQILALLDPRASDGRDMAVASDALTVINTSDGGFTESLSRMQPDSTVFGWGITPEDHFVKAISEAGLKMIASNWTTNLPVLVSAPETIASTTNIGASATPPAVEPGMHYVAFLMSDGDNLTWFTGDYTSKLFFGNPARGSIPFGWTIPFSTLAESAPDAWRNLATKATPNDDFIQFGIRGYTFIDQMPSAILACDARRLSQDLAGTKIRTLGAFTRQQWDGLPAREAFATIAQNCPWLQGILTVQYNPYAAGQGAMYVVSRGEEKVPVLSPLFAIWKLPKEDKYSGSPSTAAAVINSWAKRPIRKPEDQFTWIVVHAWSNFGDEIEGVGAAVASVKLLDPTVKVVKPSEITEMLYSQVNGRGMASP